VLAPLLVFARRLRTLAWSILFGIALVAISLLIMGVAPYRVFTHDIAPTLGRTSLIGENQALYRFLLDISAATHEDAMPHALEVTFRIAQALSFALVLMLIVVAAKPLSPHRRLLDEADPGIAITDPPKLMAAALVLVSWLLIFSPIFWEHYHAYLAPFWGWLIYEGSKSRGKMIAAILAIALAYVPSSLIASKLHMERLPEPIFSHLLWSAGIMFGMGVRALLSNGRRLVALSATSPTASPPSALPERHSDSLPPEIP